MPADKSARCAKINAAADEIDQLRSLLCEAVTATSWMPDDWKQRAKALGLPVVDRIKAQRADLGGYSNKDCVHEH